MKYKITQDYNNDTEYKDTIEEVREALENEMTEDEYDDMLDSCYSDIDICGIEYSPSLILQSVDKIAYEIGMSEYEDSLLCDMVYELENSEAGDTVSYMGYEIEVVA